MKEEIKIPVHLAEEFLDWTENQIFCNSGQHICDRLSEHFETELGKLQVKKNLNKKFP